MPRKLLTAAALGVALVASAAPAAADSAPPPNPPPNGPPSVWGAAAQYVEMIPTSTGPKPVGAAGRTKPLPESLASRFARSGGADAKALATLVTSSGWGANVTARASRAAKPKAGATKPTAGATGGSMLAVPPPRESASLPTSLGDALTSGGRATFALVALLILAAAFALVRLRRGRP